MNWKGGEMNCKEWRNSKTDGWGNSMVQELWGTPVRKSYGVAAGIYAVFSRQTM